jgi:hypothetical protein
VSDLKRSAQKKMNFIFALMPLAIGAYTFAMFKGWLLVRPGDEEFSRLWREKNKKLMLACATLSSIAGLACLIYAFGLIPDLSRVR